MPYVLHLPGSEFDDYDEKKHKFLKYPPADVTLEHSLESVFKWEAKYRKPFLVDNPQGRTPEESLYYISCMVIDKDLPMLFEHRLSRLTKEQLQELKNYIDEPQSATRIVDHTNGENGGGKHGNTSGTFMSAEKIYYYMVEIGIPWDAAKWHLSRLMLLIRIYSEENKPKKKMGPKATAERNAAINAQRRRKLGL